jgi:amino acid transporter
MPTSPKSEAAPPVYASDQEKTAGGDPSKEVTRGMAIGATAHDHLGVGKQDQTHRQLKSRHIQLIGIGGTIGTALYVSGTLRAMAGS